MINTIKHDRSFLTYLFIVSLSYEFMSYELYFLVLLLKTK